MTREEERELVERLQKGDTVAREKLIMETMKFAKYIAKDYVKPGAFFDFDDLIQECYIGLIKAVNRIAKIGLKGSTRFVSYANKAMRNEVRMELKTKSYVIKSSRRHFIENRLDMLLGAMTHFYDNDVEGPGYGGFNFVTEEDHTPGRIALHEQLIDILDEFLTLEEEDIIKLRFGFGHKYFDTPDWQKPNKPLTRDKVAKILKCSIKRVFVHEDKAMLKLQTHEVQLKLIPWL